MVGPGRFLVAYALACALACGETLHPGDAAPPQSDGGALGDAAFTEDAVADANPTNPCVPADADGSVLAHTKAGFRGRQGGCGWLYLRAPDGVPSADGGVPALSDATELSRFAAGRWYADPTPGNDFAYVGETIAHPDLGVALIRRWTSAFAGDVLIRGSLELVTPQTDSAANGITLFVFVSEREIGQVYVAPGANEVFHFAKQLAIDDTVDLVLSSGANAYYDTTTMLAEIVRDGT